LAINPIGVYVASVCQSDPVVLDADDISITVQGWIATKIKISER